MCCRPVLASPTRKVYLFFERLTMTPPGDDGPAQQVDT
jgi:hypothetical protein